MQTGRRPAQPRTDKLLALIRQHGGIPLPCGHLIRMSAEAAMDLYQFHGVVALDELEEIVARSHGCAAWPELLPEP